VSYIDDHPTTFNWTPEARLLVAQLQAAHPWKTYCNTYVWHPPYDPSNGIYRDYQAQSFDVWGGGRNRITGAYTGYRGKPLPPRLGKRIWRELWNGKHGGPGWAWGIYAGKMWVRGEGWQPAPAGAADSDPGHFGHIHITLLPF
jgi:hypothetical protein